MESIKRSIGITIIGWVIIVSVVPFWTLFYNNIFRLGMFMSTWNIIYSLLNIVTGVGLLKLKNWARLLLLFICAVKLLDTIRRSLPRLFLHNDIVTAVVDLSFIFMITIFFFWFFNKKSIKKQFKSQN